MNEKCLQRSNELLYSSVTSVDRIGNELLAINELIEFLRGSCSIHEHALRGINDLASKVSNFSPSSSILPFWHTLKASLETEYSYHVQSHEKSVTFLGEVESYLSEKEKESRKLAEMQLVARETDLQFQNAWQRYELSRDRYHSVYRRCHKTLALKSCDASVVDALEVNRLEYQDAVSKCNQVRELVIQRMHNLHQSVFHWQQKHMSRMEHFLSQWSELWARQGEMQSRHMRDLESQIQRLVQTERCLVAQVSQEPPLAIFEPGCIESGFMCDKSTVKSLLSGVFSKSDMKKGNHCDTRSDNSLEQWQWQVSSARPVDNEGFSLRPGDEWISQSASLSTEGDDSSEDSDDNFCPKIMIRPLSEKSSKDKTQLSTASHARRFSDGQNVVPPPILPFPPAPSGGGRASKGRSRIKLSSSSSIDPWGMPINTVTPLTAHHNRRVSLDSAMPPLVPNRYTGIPRTPDFGFPPPPPIPTKSRPRGGSSGDVMENHIPSLTPPPCPQRKKSLKTDVVSPSASPADRNFVVDVFGRYFSSPKLRKTWSPGTRIPVAALTVETLCGKFVDGNIVEGVLKGTLNIALERTVTQKLHCHDSLPNIPTLAVQFTEDSSQRLNNILCNSHLMEPSTATVKTFSMRFPDVTTDKNSPFVVFHEVLSYEVPLPLDGIQPISVQVNWTRPTTRSLQLRCTCHLQPRVFPMRQLRLSCPLPVVGGFEEDGAVIIDSQPTPELLHSQRRIEWNLLPRSVDVGHTHSLVATFTLNDNMHHVDTHLSPQQIEVHLVCREQWSATRFHFPSPHFHVMMHKRRLISSLLFCLPPRDTSPSSA